MNDKGYQCFHCLHYSVGWDGDFTFEDYGVEMEDDNGNVTTDGIIHVCHCSNCGAEIEYRIPIYEEPRD